MKNIPIVGLTISLALLTGCVTQPPQARQPEAEVQALPPRELAEMPQDSSVYRSEYVITEFKDIVMNATTAEDVVIEQIGESSLTHISGHLEYALVILG